MFCQPVIIEKLPPSGQGDMRFCDHNQLIVQYIFIQINKHKTLIWVVIILLADVNLTTDQ